MSTRRFLGAGLAVMFLAPACGSDLTQEELLQRNLDVFRAALHSEPTEADPSGAAATPVAGTGDNRAEALHAPSEDGVVRAWGPDAAARAVETPAGARGIPGDAPGTVVIAPDGAEAGSASGPAPGQHQPPGLPEGPGQAEPDSPKGEIRLGSIGAGSGPLGAATAAIVHGARAWAGDINTRGGLAGHPVRLILVDDRGEPSTALALAKRLVEEDRVQAFFATHAPTTEQAYTPYLEERQIPIVGTCGCSDVVDTSPMIFHVGPGAPLGAAWAHVLPFLALTDLRKVGLLYCREVAVCSRIADLVDSFQGQAGYQLVYQGQVSLVQPDYSAELLAARNAGAEVVVGVLDATALIRVARSARRQNYPVTLSAQHAINENRFLAVGGADAEGFLAAAVVHDYQESPKLAAFRAAMARHVPNGILGSFSAQTWAAGLMLERIAGGFPERVAPADILEGLYSLENETLGGLVPPMNFARGQGHGAVNQCIIPARIEGGTFVYPHGDRFTCPPGFRPAGT